MNDTHMNKRYSFQIECTSPFGSVTDDSQYAEPNNSNNIESKCFRQHKMALFHGSIIEWYTLTLLSAHAGAANRISLLSITL